MVEQNRPIDFESLQDRRLEDLRRVFATLDSDERRLLLRYHGEEKKGRRQLAEELGLSANSLRIRAHLVRRKVALAMRSDLERHRESAGRVQDFSVTPTGDVRLLPRVELVDITPQILDLLAREPDRIRELSPSSFELLVCDRLSDMGFGLLRVGGTNQKDGGIDIITWPRASPVPFLMAVQVKHAKSSACRIGPAPIRDLLGAVQMHGFNAGLFVTNTTFTPDAKWVAKQRALLMKLRDLQDLRRWLRREYLQEFEWREIPSELEVCPGVVIKLPK